MSKGRRDNWKLAFREQPSGWTVTVAEDTGKMAATISADGEGFVVFGACTLP